MFKLLTLNDFAQCVASPDPSPGGGAVGATTVAFAAACALKAVAITIKSRRSAPLENCAFRLSQIIDDGFNAADSDARAFNGLMQAFRLPNKTTEQSQERRARIAEASKSCVDVGEKLLLLGDEIRRLIDSVRPEINPNMTNDVEAAIALSHSADVIHKDNLRENRGIVQKFSPKQC